MKNYYALPPLSPLRRQNKKPEGSMPGEFLQRAEQADNVTKDSVLQLV